MYLSIGIGGYDATYVLSEFTPFEGWKELYTVGSRNNLKPNVEYEIQVKIQDSEIKLYVGNILVLTSTLQKPLKLSGQVGLKVFISGKYEYCAEKSIVSILCKYLLI